MSHFKLILKQSKITKLRIPCKKSKRVSFASSILKYVAVCPTQSRFAVKFICCIAFGSISSACFFA